jgi:hypothetical protein
MWLGVTSKITELAPAVVARELLTARAVRTTSQRMLALALGGSLDDWIVDLDRLPATADLVASVTRESYPRLDVPMHSRWRGFTL